MRPIEQYKCYQIVNFNHILQGIVPCKRPHHFLRVKIFYERMFDSRLAVNASKSKLDTLFYGTEDRGNRSFSL